MVANRAAGSPGLYMTEEQYLALDEATDGKYERLNGMVTMLRPPSSLYGTDEAILDMAGGSDAHAALCIRLGTLLSNQLEDTPCLVYSSDRRLKLPQGKALHPVGGKWQKTMKPPPVECAVAGCVDCGSHMLDASPLWCDYSCLPQSHYSSASAESQKRPEFLAASCEKQTRRCAFPWAHAF